MRIIVCMELFRKNIMLLSFLMFSISTSYSQLLYSQDIFNGGVTAGGFSTGEGTGVGNLSLHIEPGSSIRKAVLFSYSVNFAQGILYINGESFPIQENNTVSTFSHTNSFFSPISIHCIDITEWLQNNLTTNFIMEVPFQSGMPFSAVYAPFIVIEYENNSFPLINTSIMINTQGMVGNVNYNIQNLNCISTSSPVGFSLFLDRITSFSVDQEQVNVEGNLLGSLNGPDNVNNLWDAGGVKGHFYYQNNQLFGLDDDTPDAIMSGGDGLADISSYLSNYTTSLNFQLTHLNYPNQQDAGTNIDLAYFLAYTSPCDTFSVTVPNDTTVCEGTQLQLNASASNPTATYEWLPSTGLSCSDCPNPIFTADSSMFYTVRIWNNDSCSVVRPVKISVRPKPTFGTITTTPSECGASTGSISTSSITALSELIAIDGNGTVFSSGSTDGQSATIGNLGAGNYTVYFIDTNGCQSNDTIIFIDDVNSTVADFIANPLSGVVPLDVSFTNNSQNASNFEWNVNGNSEGNNLSNYTFDPSGTYEVTLVAWQNDPSCADTTYKTIFVYDSLLVEIPNVFTPNEDGINDFFSINSNMPINCHLVIVNRWGNVVFEHKDKLSVGINNLWNGTSTGSVAVLEGVYFYKIRFEENSETPEGIKLLLPAEREGFVHVER